MKLRGRRCGEPGKLLGSRRADGACVVKKFIVNFGSYGAIG